MEPVVYNNKFLSKHFLYRYCATTLDAVSKRDTPGKNYFDSAIECLDMDSYETKVCLGNADCTTDAVIGISQCDNKSLSNHRLLLVELRTNYKNALNLSKTNIERKVMHTKELLTSELPVEKKCLLVFTESVAPEARHWLNSKRYEGGVVRILEACSVREFNDNVRSFSSMPYIPIHNPAIVCDELNSYVNSCLWDKLFCKIDFWLKTIEKYHFTNGFEYESLRQTIFGWWKSFRNEHPCFDDEYEELEAEILDEDIDVRLG